MNRGDVASVAQRDFNDDLKAIVGLVRQTDIAAQQTRELIVAFGNEIAALIMELDQERVRSIGLDVRVVRREPVNSVEDAASGDDDSAVATPSETNDFARAITALYLEAFSGTPDEVRFEVQSDPGLIVLANFSANENVLQTSAIRRPFSYLDKVRGIRSSGGQISLVLVESDGAVEQSFTSRGFLGAFLTCIKEIVEKQTHFNPGL